MVRGLFFYYSPMKIRYDLIPSAKLTGHRHLAVPAKLFNTNLTKIQLDLGISRQKPWN